MGGTDDPSNLVKLTVKTLFKITNHSRPVSSAIFGRLPLNGYVPMC